MKDDPRLLFEKSWLVGDLRTRLQPQSEGQCQWGHLWGLETARPSFPKAWAPCTNRRADEASREGEGWRVTTGSGEDHESERRAKAFVRVSLHLEGSSPESHPVLPPIRSLP